jgi:hypothetical protein
LVQRDNGRRPPRQFLQKLCLVGNAQANDHLARLYHLADIHASGARSR